MLERRRVLGQGPGLLFKCPRTISTSNGYHSLLPHSCQLEPRQKYSPDEPRDSGDEELLTSPLPLSHRQEYFSRAKHPFSNIALDFYTGPYPYWTAIYFANRAACVYAAGGGWAWWRRGVCPNVLITAASDQSEMVTRSAARICVCVGGCSLGPPPAPCQSHTDKYVVHRQHTPAQVARWGRLIFLNMSAALIIFYTL